MANNMNNTLLNNRFSDLEDIKYSREKCVRCNMCKFIPLARVEHQAFSMGCPAYEEYNFTANSGGGIVIMANSLASGRSTVTEAVAKTVFNCTLCGLCDVSCKHNNDIEVLETLLLARKKIFDENALQPEHQLFLDHIKTAHHPITTHVSDKNQANHIDSDPNATRLLWVGPHFARDQRYASWLNNIIAILKSTGMSFKLLYDAEPYTGRAALELGDFQYFMDQSKRVEAAIAQANVSEIICLSAEDYSTLRSQTPKFATIKTPIKHIVEVYESLIDSGKLAVKSEQQWTDMAWHDPCYLGRLGGRFTYWEGRKKLEFGMPIYEPARPINYGSDGVFEPPRHILKHFAYPELKEFSRRKEYSFNAGESGQALISNPEFALNTAKRRLQEAAALGIQTIVTECPQAYTSLKNAAGFFENIEVISLTSLLASANRKKI